MSRTWTRNAASYIESMTNCPRCDRPLDTPGWCRACGADLSTEQGEELAQVSRAAATLIHRRQELIDALPIRAATAISAPAVDTAPASPAALASTPVVSTGASSQLSVQSVLAVAGAGLVAVAAFVFTFLNPDLTDFATRTLIVAGITVVFLGSAWLLARAALQFSAEAVGALGTVFAALDIWALSTRAPDGTSPWVFAAVGTLVVGAGLVGLTLLARIRAWLWIGLVGLAIVPAMLGYAAGGPWGPVFGHVGVVAVALALGLMIPRLAGRFDSHLGADRGTLTALQFLAIAVVGIQLVTTAAPFSVGRVLMSALTLALVGGLALLNGRVRGAGGITSLWDYLAGAFLVLAVAILPLVLPLETFWFAALIPLAALMTLLAIARLFRAPAGLWGGWTVALVATVPASSLAVFGAFTLGTFIPREWGLASALGLAAASAGALGLSVLVRRTLDRESRFAATATGGAIWLGALTLVAVVVWAGFLPITQIAIGLVLAAALAVIAPRVGHRALRGPFIATAHALLLLAAAISWSEALPRLIAGTAVVVIILLLGRALPVAIRAIYVALAYAYALVIVANALDLAGLETIAVLCLTTSVGSLFALVVTLIRRVPVRHWYAILGVTAVPFLIGVGSVIAVRSGWTGLSTGVTFALALTLVVSRRPGLTRPLRAVAAGLLVPALAVVVICLGAQFLVVSASPITLPIIAGIVAVALPLTGVIGRALERHGLGSADARAVRLWIEISSLITGAIAVLLALVRVAAGLETTLLVLLIIGVGGAATAVLMRRRYGWVVAATSWTGALWCFWALNGVSFIEPYTLPPAVGAVIVGAVGVALGKPAKWLFAGGLAAAVIPTLGILAVVGDETEVPVRAVALLGASAALVVAAAVVRRWERLRPLVAPALVMAVVAAAAGVAQSMRYGWELDPLELANPDYVILPVLALTVPATVLAVAAGRVAQRDGAVSRWIYAPALVMLVLGPMTAIRRDWLPVFTLWGLMVLLLVVMLVTVTRARARRTTLAPVWFIYLVAWCTGVVGWTMRDLRVEVFSLPLGFALLAAGVIAMRRSMPARATLESWPHGFRGSWHLLTPGIVATLLPSMLATGTDPQTARAILVIGLALVAILIGSLRKLAAPFILGIIVLPIENVIVFAVQVGRSIGAAPWWITLATAGAVLLVIAVTYERRGKTVGGFSARLRDLT